jgi:hypothetical protein
MIENVSNTFEKPILIHVCKDKTLSFRRRHEPIFNGVALPVYSVDTVEDAKDLITMVGRAQYHEHPLLPGQVWYKITLNGDLDFKRYLDIEDLTAVTEKLDTAYKKIKAS